MRTLDSGKIEAFTASKLDTEVCCAVCHKPMTRRTAVRVEFAAKPRPVGFAARVHPACLMAAIGAYRSDGERATLARAAQAYLDYVAKEETRCQSVAQPAEATA